MWDNLKSVIDSFSSIGQKLIPLIVIVAFLLFVLGVGRFIRSTGSETEVAKTKNLLIWGVIGLFVIFSIWGLVAFLQGEFFGSTDIGIPQINLESR